MAYSEAQKRATAKYQKENYDEIRIRVPKGDRQSYKDQASAKGMSLNAYIISLLKSDALELAE